MRFIKCHQPQYDKLWKKLVNLKVLRPLNMKEFICNIESAFQHTSEREQAEKAVKFAKSAVMSVEKAITDSQHSSLFKTEAQQWLAAAQSKLNAALKTLKLIKRQNDLIYDFHKMTEQLKVMKNKLIKSYLTWRKDTERCIKLLWWILQQVPLIELELKVITNYSIQRNMRVQWRLKRNHTHEFNEERVSKQQRQNDEISDCRTHTFTVKKLENQHKHSCNDLLNEEQATKQCKHNGQNHILCSHRTSDIIDSTFTEEPLFISTLITRFFNALTARSATVCAMRHPDSKKTRSEAKTLAKVVLNEKAHVMKREREDAKFSNLSTLSFYSQWST